ncbi:guanosine monophosphate reductase [Halobacteriovorax marinus]|uniref:IMP dehydrogenase n=1 Tax=Halobacteriovorax marinus TaxID=97084 RepID=UPI0002EDA2CD|nr:IMP dehydrogenase [Halobacteriovorax marinus]ATH08183.1 guanosine monophosphate reductase [Halobacteriovorax marinus]
MELVFNAQQILKRGKGLTFDDVLLVPRHSEIASRRIPSLRSKATKNFEIETPVISANMDTVTGVEMACAMAKLGGLGILHRFMSPEEQVEDVKKIQKYIKDNNLSGPVAASIGVKEEGKLRAKLLADIGVDILTIDIAHGDSVMMLETLEYVKKTWPHIDVIAGNVATGEGVKRMIDLGADAVKVGIGPGSMCTTRIITGHGVPQLSAIAMCVEEAIKHDVPVIADGGIKTSGDIVKALCAGAQTIMAGSLLSGTLETPGELKGGMKEYRGMASKAAQVSWRGELPKGMAAEGVDTMVPCKGPVEEVISELTGGLRSGMTYLGVDNIADMKEVGLFMEMSTSGMVESRPHGKN